MIKSLFQWLLMRKVKNEAGKLEAKGFSITKICATVIAIMQAVEIASPYFGHAIVFDPKIYVAIASIGGVALKEGVDRSAPPASVSIK